MSEHARPAGPGSTFALAVDELILDPGELDPASVLSGTPAVTEATLWTSEDGRIIRGVWQITEGTVTDVEADELFVVVAGRATVEVEGGATLELAPGVMGVLARGARTTWTVHETLRKVFQITLPD
jgi:uncharacterized cupin superfamily protein